MLGTARSPSLTTIHSRTDEERETGDVTLQQSLVTFVILFKRNFGFNTFVPGNSLVPSSYMLTCML